MKELNKNDRIQVLRFSKSRYLRLKDKPNVSLINKMGRDVRVIELDAGEDSKHALVEESYYNEHSKKDEKQVYYIKQSSGKDMWHGRGNVFILIGHRFKKGELVVHERPTTMGRDIFFWHGCDDEGYYEHVSAYSPYNDMHDAQICFAHTKATWGKDDYMRPATEKDEKDFRNALLEYDRVWTDDGYFRYYPRVGKKYYEIYFENGQAAFRECLLEREEDRPKPSALILECDESIHLELREKRVRERVEKINKALND